MKNEQQLNVEKTKLEIKKLKKENWILQLTIATTVATTLWGFGAFLYTKYLSITDLSKYNNLTPHKTQRISLTSRNIKTGVTFWYIPEKRKNQGVVMKIMKHQYVVISSTHNVKISILNSKGDFIPLVSLSELNWMFQVPETDDHTIVLGGKEKAEIAISIPPEIKEENIMRYTLYK